MKTSIVKSTQTEKLVPTTIAVVGFIALSSPHLLSHLPPFLLFFPLLLFSSFFLFFFLFSFSFFF
ncbi:hypothetical protein FVE09_12460, partial [Listeria monocytogenes]